MRHESVFHSAHHCSIMSAPLSSQNSLLVWLQHVFQPETAAVEFYGDLDFICGEFKGFVTRVILLWVRKNESTVISPLLLTVNLWASVHSWHSHRPHVHLSPLHRCHWGHFIWRHDAEIDRPLKNDQSLSSRHQMGAAVQCSAMGTGAFLLPCPWYSVMQFTNFTQCPFVVADKWLRVCSLLFLLYPGFWFSNMIYINVSGFPFFHCNFYVDFTLAPLTYIFT